jgi:plasmid stability protein
MKVSTHEITLALSDADYEALQVEAARRGVEVSEALAEVLRDGLEERRDRAAFGEALSAYGREIGVDSAEEAQRLADQEIAAMRAEQRAGRR